MDSKPKQTTAYREVQIGNTLFRITSVFTGERELSDIMEELVVRKAMAEIRRDAPIRSDAS